MLEDRGEASTFYTSEEFQKYKEQTLFGNRSLLPEVLIEPIMYIPELNGEKFHGLGEMEVHQTRETRDVDMARC